MSNKAAKRESKVTRCVKAPYRILCRARDFYVRSLTDFSGKMSYGIGVGGLNSVVPRSFSVNSSRSYQEEDIRELMRVTYQRGQVEKVEMNIRKQQQSSMNLPRSFTVGNIGRIDEDKSCRFDEDFEVRPKSMYSRSDSSAITKRARYLL